MHQQLSVCFIQGEGCAYRGRALVELVTKLLDEEEEGEGEEVETKSKKKKKVKNEKVDEETLKSLAVSDIKAVNLIR